MKNNEFEMILVSQLIKAKESKRVMLALKEIGASTTMDEVTKLNLSVVYSEYYRYLNTNQGH